MKVGSQFTKVNCTEDRNEKGKYEKCKKNVTETLAGEIYKMENIFHFFCALPP